MGTAAKVGLGGCGLGALACIGIPIALVVVGAIASAPHVVHVTVHHTCPLDGQRVGADTSRDDSLPHGQSEATDATVADRLCDKHAAETVKLVTVAKLSCSVCSITTDGDKKTTHVARKDVPSGAKANADFTEYTLDAGTKEDKSVCTGKACLCAVKHGWTVEDCKTIAEGKVHVGMTAEQCRAAWGSPDKVNTTINANGRSEQWVYGEYGERGFLYMDDGVLTSIQN